MQPKFTTCAKSGMTYREYERPKGEYMPNIWKPLMVHMDEELKQAVRETAARSGRSMSNWCKIVIEDALAADAIAQQQLREPRPTYAAPAGTPAATRRANERSKIESKPGTAAA